MSVFRSPGLADQDAPTEVTEAWNDLIAREVSRHAASPFLVLDPSTITSGDTSRSVKWPGHPLEPEDCLGEERAAKLSDWGWAGRAELHNEYLEYGLIMHVDQHGQQRPKRFRATTELMEWWRTMAVFAPDYFLRKVEQITGSSYELNELLSVGSAQWLSRTVDERRTIFHTRLVGNGRTEPPLHSLNMEWQLFMSHSINGLDDLIYVVHFGAFPYVINESGIRRRARIEEIFVNKGTEYLFCRNADPAAASGAYGQAFISGTDSEPQGKKVAFADPLGMYMQTFSTGGLYYDGNQVPPSWTSETRGAEHAMVQRLEFGPPDDHPAFLDDIKVGSTADAPPLTGFQIARLIEVGPVVFVGEKRRIGPSEFVEIRAVPDGAITCGSQSNTRCTDIRAFNRDYERAMSFTPGTRGGSGG